MIRAWRFRSRPPLGAGEEGEPPSHLHPAWLRGGGLFRGPGEPALELPPSPSHPLLSKDPRACRSSTGRLYFATSTLRMQVLMLLQLRPGGGLELGFSASVRQSSYS